MLKMMLYNLLLMKRVEIFRSDERLRYNHRIRFHCVQFPLPQEFE